MAKFEHKDNTGSLFKNGYKTKDNHPDFTGTCKINGVDYKMAGWTKTTKSGERMVSMSFAEDVEREDYTPSKKVNIDDEILF